MASRPAFVHGLLTLGVLLVGQHAQSQNMHWGYQGALFSFTVFNAKTGDQLETGHFSYSATVTSNGKWFGSIWQQQYSGNCDFEGRIPVGITWRFPNASPMSFTCNWNVSINVPGYEQQSISGATLLEREFALFNTPNVGSNAITQKVFLVPFKKDVELSGSLDVSTRSTPDIGLYSIEDLASKLSVDYDALLRQLKENNIPIKTFGNKSFVTKSDWEKFLAQ